MIEETVIAYLNTKLVNIPVYMEKPEEKPASYVVIRTLDQGRKDFIDAVTLEFTSFAPDLLEAMKLNDSVKKAMYDIISLGNISSSKLGGNSQAIQTNTKEYAFECIFNLYYKEV